MQYRNTVDNMAFKYLLPLLLAAAVLPAQAKMYKWVDAQGNVHYTDTLPPASASQGNAELSKTGNVVKKTESAEEKQKRLAAEAEAAERRKLQPSRRARIVPCWLPIPRNRKSISRATVRWSITT